MDNFRNYINHLEFAQPQFIENVQILPILGKDFYSDRFGFLTDSLKNGFAEITEVSDDGNVPKILFKNNGDRPILLIDGEELKGCKQNRVLNLSVLAPEKRDIEIPVSCVEQGRWRHSSRNFQTSDNFEFADIKVAKMRSVSACMKRSEEAYSDQGAVWDAIASKSSRVGSESSTGAMSGIYSRNRSEISSLLKKRNVLDNQIGSVFLINGKVKGIEIFNSNIAFRQYEEKITRSYLLTSFTRESVDYDSQELEEQIERCRDNLLKKVEINMKKMEEHIHCFRDENRYSFERLFAELRRVRSLEDIERVTQNQKKRVPEIKNTLSEFVESQDRVAEELDRELDELSELIGQLKSRMRPSRTNSNQEEAENTKNTDLIQKSVKEFLERLKQVSIETYKGVGMGENFRGDFNNTLVGGLSWQGELIHLSSVSAIN